MPENEHGKSNARLCELTLRVHSTLRGVRQLDVFLSVPTNKVHLGGEHEWTRD